MRFLDPQYHLDVATMDTIDTTPTTTPTKPMPSQNNMEDTMMKDASPPDRTSPPNTQMDCDRGDAAPSTVTNLKKRGTTEHPPTTKNIRHPNKHLKHSQNLGPNIKLKQTAIHIFFPPTSTTTNSKGAPPPQQAKKLKQTCFKPTIPFTPKDNGPAQQPTHHAQSPQDYYMDNIHFLLLNCRGLRSSWELILNHILDHKPDVAILTETKLLSCLSFIQFIKKELPQYSLHHSSVAKTPDNNHGKGGVIILTHKQLGPPVHHEVNADLAGCLVHITFGSTTPTPTHIIGVYMPHDQPQQRQAAYTYIGTHTKKPNHTTLCGGDWNATLFPSDRSTHATSHTDQHHISMCSQLNLHPTNPSTRAPTFHCYQEGNLEHHSRIDDILISPCPNPLHPHISEKTREVGGYLDHMALHQIIPPIYLPIPLTLTDTPPPRPQQLVTPVSKASMNATRKAIEETHTTFFMEHTQTIRDWWDQATNLIGDNSLPSNLHQVKHTLLAKGLDLDHLSNQIMEPIRMALTTMFETCPTRNQIPGHFLDRKKSKAHAKINSHIQQLKTYRKILTTDPNSYHTAHSTLLETCHNHPTTLTHIQLASDHASLLAAINISLDEALPALRRILTNSRQTATATGKAAFMTQLSNKPKQAHRNIFKTSDNPTSPQTLQDPTTGQHKTSTNDLLDILGEHMGHLMAPPHHTCTGKYLPQDRQTAPPPWASLLDTFSLETKAQPHQHSNPILPYLMEFSNYQTCIQHVAKSKQAGPDGIPNELLTCLPWSWHHTIHKMFGLMWITGYTPICWKTSNTIMLYKKGDPTQANHYRPIGLNNTMGKLWTNMVTTVMSKYLDQYQVLSDSQEGFRQNRSTHRQLTHLLHDIEDAAHSKRDLFAAYFDFSSAFNMVDHDKLLQTMYDLGIPVDVIETVKGIYNGATTHMYLNNTQGKPIQITRGTIQGDTLSPLLFIIFIEPLLRWLQAGGRGYKQGITSTSNTDQDKTGSLGYADDTSVVTNTADNLKVQCLKVQQFSTWSGIPLNGGKCMITGILHGSHPKDPTNHKALTKLLHNTILINDTWATYLPPNEPYKYLGVPVSLTLNWRPLMKQALALIHSKGHQILTTAKPKGATPLQCLRLITTCIKPAITYPMTVAPYSYSDIGILDKALWTLAKKCCDLHPSFPTASVCLPLGQAGLGIPSLMVDYAQITAAHLTRSLNDTGKLGRLTTALLHKEATMLQGMDPLTLPSHTLQYFTLARQMHILKRASIQIHMEDETLLNPLQDSLPDLPQHTIPPNLLKTLIPLGITSLADIVSPDGTTIIPSNTLSHTYGTRVSTRHKVALNRLSLHLCSPPPPGSPSQPYSCHSPLPLASRTLPIHLRIPQRHITKFSTYTISHHLNNWDTAPILPRPLTPSAGILTPTTTQPPTHNIEEIPASNAHMWWARESYLHPTKYAQAWSTDPKIAWTARMQFIRNDTHKCTDASYYKHHTIRKNSSPDDLVHAVSTPDLLAPPTPAKLLHLLYGNQHSLTHLLGFRAQKRKANEPRETPHHRYWRVQKAPCTILCHHLPCYISAGLPVHSHNYSSATSIVVTWSPVHLTEEQITLLVGPTRFQELLHAYNTETTPKAPSPSIPPRQDLHLTNLQQQGQWAEGGEFDAKWYSELRQNLIINTADHHPDWDIHPPGKYHIQAGTLNNRYHHLPPQLKNGDTTYIYSPTGQCVGHIPLSQLHLLHHRYHTTKAHSPHLWTLHSTGTFAGDVATLLSQHKDTTISNVSPAIHKAMSTLGMTKDLDTSPLLMSPHLPMGNTPTPIGQLFGLGPHCYTQPWYGGNTHLTSQNPEEAHKAVRWALGSAIHAHTLDIPACTILLVPQKPTYAHNALLNHPWAMELATLPPKAKPLTPSLIWTGGKLNPTKRHRGTYKLIAISNPAGHAKYLHNPPTTWAQTMRDMGATSIPRPGPPPSQLGLPTTHLPKALSSLLKTWAQQPTPMQIDPTPITPPVLPCTHAILQAPGLALYTDGSAIIDKDGVLRLGAGVYSPRAASRCLRIDPGGQGITADINRAELVAIQQALIHSEIDEELTIYSDSLCSLQLINLHIYHPSRTRENKHRDLLQDIAIHIINRHNAAATTRLLKVRSHSGIIGNDEADTLAKEATTGYNVIGPVKTGEHAHLNMHWPSVQPPKSINGDQPPRHPANNLTKGIKANLPTPLHTGHANTTGIYSSMWEQANPFLLPQASNRFWQSTDMKWWQKIQIHKARWGRLWTRKLAYRYKRPYGTSTSPPSDDNCPLCRKAQDGAGHILAGCSHPVFKGMYINRHNKAVQLIQKAVAKGALGALPMYMDAGTCEATSDIPTRPPATLKPPDLPQATWDKYRPDLLLIDDESKPRKAYLVELGYCSDTNHQIKFQEKSVQHKELQRILQQQGFLVHYLVFTIGTTGTIPIPTITNLSTLGISREHVDKLISKLHRESTASCTSILATRRMKESLPPGG